MHPADATRGAAPMGLTLLSSIQRLFDDALENAQGTCRYKRPDPTRCLEDPSLSGLRIAPNNFNLLPISCLVDIYRTAFGFLPFETANCFMHFASCVLLQASSHIASAVKGRILWYVHAIMSSLCGLCPTKIWHKT